MSDRHPAPAVPRRGFRLDAPAASAAVLAAVACVGCAVGEAAVAVPTVEVEPAAFQIRIPATGELAAAQATPVAVPATLRGMQRISWLAPEGSEVRAGDPVARLDAKEIDDRLERSHESLDTLDKELAAKRATLDDERLQLDTEMALLVEERAKAERFAPRDAMLFSRHEILDAEMDLELIATKIEHTRTKLERLERRAAAEMEILRLRRQTEETRIAQLEEARSSLAIAAPHDGIFLYGRTWQGEKMRVGMSIWAGQPLGELPDTSKMQAKLWILEAEASGLAEGLPGAVEIDAYPGREWTGKITTVQPVANPIVPESPVKYFEVVMALDETDQATMKPGSRVRGSVWVAREDEVLSVPNQAIFHDGDETWVWIEAGARFERRPVAIGERSVSRTVVVSGVAQGERVALVDPGRPGEA
jgi:multidrug efflux pump subunit AcrA (membrane-fusion protein)